MRKYFLGLDQIFYLVLQVLDLVFIGPNFLLISIFHVNNNKNKNNNKDSIHLNKEVARHDEGEVNAFYLHGATKC